ncbi:MAG: NPCBM-associated, domain of alpha-galactosidase [Thermoplasmata archaeon]|jgi:hypothetical protein|nr:NPCBM-associated, domain of alpha-galactosidase [Thermoplasmata archaeon]
MTPRAPLLLLLAALLPAAHAGTALDPESSDPQDTSLPSADLRALWFQEDGTSLVLSMRLGAVPDAATPAGLQAARDGLQFSFRFHAGATAWEWRETLKSVYLPDGTPGLQLKDELLKNGTDVGRPQDPVGDAQAFPDALLGTADPAYSASQDAAAAVRTLTFLHARDHLAAGTLLTDLTGSVRSLADESLDTVPCGGTKAMDCADAPAPPYEVGTPPPLPGVRAAVAPLTLGPGQSANATLLLNNTGQARELGFTARMPPGWQVRFTPATASLARGATAAVQAAVTAPANATGPARLTLHGFEDGKAVTATLAVQVAAPPAPAAVTEAPSTRMTSQASPSPSASTTTQKTPGIAFGLVAMGLLGAVRGRRGRP